MVLDPYLTHLFTSRAYGVLSGGPFLTPPDGSFSASLSFPEAGCLLTGLPPSDVVTKELEADATEALEADTCAGIVERGVIPAASLFLRILTSLKIHKKMFRLTNNEKNR